MPASDDDIRNQLYHEAGVNPSMHWIRSYRAHQHQDNHSADVMLQHILYHDLRDVVRELDPPATAGEPPQDLSTSNSPSQQWRQMVRAQQAAAGSSNSTESSLKTILPESFRLMIQVEEVIDVASNAETRLGGNNHSGGGTGQRCLKLCISDGCYENGSAYPNANNNHTAQQQQQQAMLAMEVTPIPNLTMASQAGLKLLLHGPIDIRWGVLMLHEGNALVLGGSVKELVDIQAKALEEAKREAGVGVDPTVRALIWNPDTGEEEEEDEGEQGSSDVAAPAPPPMGPQAPSMPAVVPNRQQVHNPLMPQHQRNNIHAHQQAQQNRPAQHQPPAVTPTPIPNNSTPSVSQIPVATSRPGPSNPSQPTQAQAVSRPQPQGNPYARNSAARSRNNLPTASQNSLVPSRSSSASMPAAAAASAAVMAPPTNRPRNVLTNETTTRHSAASGTVGAPIGSDDLMEDTSVSTSLATSQSVDMSFDELKEMLMRVRQNETMYRQQYGKTFTVNMRQCASHHYFNIDKVKKRDRKKEDKKERKRGDKKYEYAMHVKFSGPTNSDDDCISCTISSDILEPYFVYAPAEMRNLNKTDREKSAAHINVSGRQARDAFFKLSLWEVTLFHPVEDFFQSSNPVPSPLPLDGKQPVLMLLSRREGG